MYRRLLARLSYWRSSTVRRSWPARKKLLHSLLSDSRLALILGRAAQERVRERFLSLRSLSAYAELIVG